MQISNVEMLDSLSNKQMDNMQIEQKYSIEQISSEGRASEI